MATLYAALRYVAVFVAGGYFMMALVNRALSETREERRCWLLAIAGIMLAAMLSGCAKQPDTCPAMLASIELAVDDETPFVVLCDFAAGETSCRSGDEMEVTVYGRREALHHLTVHRRCN